MQPVCDFWAWKGFILSFSGIIVFIHTLRAEQGMMPLQVPYFRSNSIFLLTRCVGSGTSCVLGGFSLDSGRN